LDFNSISAIDAVGFIICISVVVFVHEFGHYIVGRWSGIKAEVFSLGFGPVLVSRIDSRGTRWQFAMIPFGGYVKFLGDKDAASSGDYQEIVEMDTDVKRQTMHGAPLWARTATVAAGPLFNFILSILIFSSIAFWQGQARDPLTVGALHPSHYEHEYGLETNDVLLEINGDQVPSLLDAEASSSFWQSLSDESRYNYKVLRNDRVFTVEGPNLSLARVDQVLPGSAASDAQMRVGDVIMKINNTQIYRFQDLKAFVENSNGSLLSLTVWRKKKIVLLQLTPKFEDRQLEDGRFQKVWQIGIAGGQFFFDPQVTTIKLRYALMFGAQNTWRIINGSLEGLYFVVKGQVSPCVLSGPLELIDTSGQMLREGGKSYIWWIAFFSTAIGFMNLLPIPVLDGGHLVFFFYEGVVGKPISPQILNGLMLIGLGLLVSLMIFTFYNDVVC
jgi:regulator of sigma E protease